tara:strand:- start:94459 stop:94812 length:354 start_codon:yes stop_codon:yes gene_type:complete
MKTVHAQTDPVGKADTLDQGNAPATQAEADAPHAEATLAGSVVADAQEARTVEAHDKVASVAAEVAGTASEADDPWADLVDAQGDRDETIASVTKNANACPNLRNRRSFTKMIPSSL